MPLPRPFPRRRLATAVLAALAACWAAGLLVLPPAAAQLASNVGLVTVASSAGVSALLRSRRHDGGVRRFWRWLGLAALSWAGGQATWAWYESVRGQAVPFPSFADAGYLALPPLAVLALLALPAAAPSLTGRVRSLVDGLVVAAALLLTSWVLVLRHVVETGRDSATGLALSLAYPVGDVVVISLVSCTLVRVRRQRVPVPLGLVGAGLLCLAFSDSSFVYLTNTGGYSSGSGIDAGWFTGFALLLVATWAPSREVPADAGEAPGADSRTHLLPFASLAVALLASSAETLRIGHSDVVSYWIRTAILVLVLVRQALTLRENRALTRDLEDRVAERTAELSAGRERFAALVEHGSDLVLVTDVHGVVSYQSGSSRRILGIADGDLLGRNVSELARTEGAGAEEAGAEEAQALLEALHRVPPGGSLTVRSTWRHAAGHHRVMEVTVTDLRRVAAVGGLVLNSRDVTERVELERQLTHQAFTDALTDLPNRALFSDRLDHALRGGQPLAVLFVDLDGFKAVNDTLGHGAGDRLLVLVADRLRLLLRPADTVARFGGDEFAVLALDVPDEAAASAVALRVVAELGRPYELDGEVVHATGSVGVSFSGGDRVDADALLREADLAMYHAKSSARSSSAGAGHALFQRSMHEALVERVRLESDLRDALLLGQFALQYQPLFDMGTGRVRGVEALARWHHPERGNVPPTTFIPVAESTGLIDVLGAWVLREACAQAVAWGPDPATGTLLRMSVNLSGLQLTDPALPEQVALTLSETGFPADRLTLELTESVLVDTDEASVRTLHALRNMGIRIAIDDFGTGYSSLSYLHTFPVDVLKIDRSFVGRLTGGGDTSIVLTILGLARSLQLEAVAEGIEEREQWDVLREEGCETGQGYHFSPPVAPDAVMALVHQASGAAATRR